MPTLIIDSEESRRDGVWILDLHHWPHTCGPISTPPAGVFIWALPSTVFLLRLRSRADVRYLWLESEACDAGGISVSPEVLTTKVPAKVADTPSWNLAPGCVFWILSRLNHSRRIGAP
ncbi:hypothetical protein IG631_05853 [Alternaria alternata]|nr:hypothetical protein IG631_05853 [Alternaria alternata]